MNSIDKNLEMYTGIKWWKEKRRKTYLRSFVFISFINIVFGFMFFSVAESMSAKDMLFIFAILGIFSFVAIDQLIHYLKLPSTQINQYWLGHIIGTRRVVRRNKKSSAYYIIANINGKELEARCLYDTYLRAEVGDEVILFSLGKNSIHCVHCDMP